MASRVTHLNAAPRGFLPLALGAVFSLLVGTLHPAAAAPGGGQNAIAAAPDKPEIWFFLRGYAMNPQNSHGVDGQQGWRKLFVEPDAPWPPFWITFR